MKLSLAWSDLLIEEGKLDPLGLWRVGDRLNDDLLKPFTTVVLHRPARYFSMYSWMFYYLEKCSYKDNKLFWKHFFRMEVILLSAIQLHKTHNYENFRGQIGSESAKKLLETTKDIIDLKKTDKLRNGWEVNYKMPMFAFGLLQVDFDSPNNIRLTEKGRNIAHAYENVISGTAYFRKYLDELRIPLDVIKKLSEVSCPCLTFATKNTKVINERESIIDNMLKGKGLIQSEEDTKLLSSIYLILNCMMSVKLPFDKFLWHRILSTQVYKDGKNIKAYVPPPQYDLTFRKWQIYNDDLLFVYALENGLSGFLQNLQEIGDMKFNELADIGKGFLSHGLRQFKKDKLKGLFPLKAKMVDSISALTALSPKERFIIEDLLFEHIYSSTGGLTVFYSFLLYLYVQANHISKHGNIVYKPALGFYNEASSRDGLELSLVSASNDLKYFGDGETEGFFVEYFIRRWIANRQIDTRFDRGKDIAWFSYNHETKTINFEANYDAYLYRASRLNILMTYLLNLEVVHYEDDHWVPNSGSSLFPI